MFFRDIPGQDEIKEFLKGICVRQEVPHAMLFSGAAGRGTLPLVRAFSSLLFCSHPQDGESCGECKNCAKTHKLSHPDMHISIPVSGAKKIAADFMGKWREMMLEHPYASLNDWQSAATHDAKQLNINVKEIGEILEFASLKSYEGGKKVLVIWMAEYLEKEGNRLLKLIEEPPPGMFVILVTENEDRILNTIHSRTQSILVKPLPDEEIAQYLSSVFGLDNTSAQKTAFLSDGNINRAIGLMEEDRNDWLQEFVSWLRACYVLKPHKLSAKVSDYTKWGREEQKYFLEVGLTAIESILVSKYIGSQGVRLPEEDLKPINNLSELLGLDQLFKLSQILNQSISDIEQNVNSKVLFMRQSISIHYAMHKKDKPGLA